MAVCLPPSEPFDLMPRRKPPLDGFYWEDIVFVPIGAASRPSNEGTKDRLASVGFLLVLTALMVGGIRHSITQPDAEEHVMLAHVGGEPETTGSLKPELRPSLPD